MMAKEITRLIWIVVISTCILWGAYLVVFNYEIASKDSFKAVATTATVVTFLTHLYLSWAWKLPWLNLLFFRTNLNGTWLGEFRSDWTDAHGNTNPPGKFVLVIRQNFLQISIRAYSKIQNTYTYGEDFSIDEKSNTKRLAYMFTEKRATSGRHGVRQGAADLELAEGKSEKTLYGDFWTYEKTTGFVRVKLVDQKQFVESFKDAEKIWPEFSQWAKIDP